MKLAWILLYACVCSAQTYTTLYTFQGGTDGAFPQGPLTFDSQGNIYGASAQGGINDSGTIFQLSPTSVKTILYTFQGGADGTWPNGGLLLDAGNLYGTTAGGPQGNGYGTVFRLSPSGVKTILFSFNGTNGLFPSPVIADSVGNLYGTTEAGGAYNRGTVYELVLQPSGSYVHKIIYMMYKLAMDPGTLMLDSTGIYGTASGGGKNLSYPYGSVFKLTPNGTGWTRTVHSFTSLFAHPVTGVIMQTGNLYGISYGGAGNYGTVFMGSSTLLSRFYPLHIFSQAEGNPKALVIDANGNFYGSTYDYPGRANGLIFKLNPYTILYNFGSDPEGPGLTVDGSGNLYGVTEGDGVTSFGTVFELQP